MNNPRTTSECCLLLIFLLPLRRRTVGADSHLMSGIWSQLDVRFCNMKLKSSQFFDQDELHFKWWLTILSLFFSQHGRPVRSLLKPKDGLKPTSSFYACLLHALHCFDDLALLNAFTSADQSSCDCWATRLDISTARPFSNIQA